MSASAQENSYAERINKTIKEEYLYYWNPSNFKELKKYVEKAVYQYNHKRVHNNLGKLSPIDFETMWFNNSLKNKPILTIFDEERDKNAHSAQVFYMLKRFLNYRPALFVRFTHYA